MKHLKSIIKTGFILMAFNLSSLSYAKVSKDDYQHRKELNRQLWIMAEVGNTDEVSRLLKQGADIHAKKMNKSGKTALHFASKKGHIEMVRLLIDKGADTNTRDKYGLTPLHLASMEGHTEIVRLLIENKANVHAWASSGETALHLASRNGHIEIVQLLLEGGSYIYFANEREDEKLAYDYAVENGHTDIAQLLKSKATENNWPQAFGQSFYFFFGKKK